SYPWGDAVVPLKVRGAGVAPVNIEAVIDTGFNDWLTLPQTMIQSLGLPLREEGRYSLADGSEMNARFFAAQVEWFDQIRHVLVLEMECSPLLGMGMLRGTQLKIQVMTGGRVEIAPL